MAKTKHRKNAETQRSQRDAENYSLCGACRLIKLIVFTLRAFAASASLRLTRFVPARMGMVILVLGLPLGVVAEEETWPAALSRMPLATGAIELNRTNCAQLILGGFQSNATVKALIFMPGATDELYFFRRVQATVTNANPSLLDAVVALTNQSPLRVVFRAPFLLLYSEEDVLDLDIQIKHERTAAKLKSGKPVPHIAVIDRDWTQLLKVMKKRIGPTLIPYEGTSDSWHFYRHTFASWNLTQWEAMEACALAGKTKFTVIRNGVSFELDHRVGAMPTLDRFPGR
jgi:hypothetical protein